ncbi:S-layer family protein [Leptolyngbya sp. CCNP1308]|uniref:S-layer family protein n=1 Tax=Leptolyngbya sp. CCNP1308 TaxID=3110255 RepID=UPI002B2096C7|nr:S-layer family protein [Leptolyngbya sp. CCNP1308]MEA5449692.1 S-layer family protein [Leptolyngbya sp. CCNP1308]
MGVLLSSRLPLAAVAGLLVSSPAWAQSAIVPDSTLGAESSQVIQINGLPVEAILGGAIRDQNLFHSFEEFNIDTGQGAYFIAPSEAIANIFARVTGDSPSNIFGVLGTASANGGVTEANLFFINPNGILFSETGSLDVGGSFTATTADSVLFGDRGSFSATTPELPSSLLTIDPSAYFFSPASSGDITSRSAVLDPFFGVFRGLWVPIGETLTLLGGSVTVDGRNVVAGLRAFGGRINIGAASGTGNVEINLDGGLSFDSSLNRQALALLDTAIVDVTLDRGGYIDISARNILFENNSGLYAGIRQNFGFEGAQAGNIDISATGDLRLVSGSFVENDVNRNGTGNSGNLSITARSIEIGSPGYLSSSTFGNGNSGNVEISVNDDITLRGDNTTIVSFVANTARGNGGSLNVRADTINILGGQISSGILGTGNSGQISIKARDILIDSNGSFLSEGISSGIGSSGRGIGGGVLIDTENLNLINGASIFTGVTGIGIASDITIRAQNITLSGQASEFAFSGASISSRLGAPFSFGGGQLEGGVGQAGNIDIRTNTLKLTDDAAIEAFSAGFGDAGNVDIEADQILFSDSSSIFVNTVFEGNAGDINVKTNILSLRDGAQFLAFSEGEGRAGNITITAQNLVELFGYSLDTGTPSALFTDNESRSVGAGGDITITTNRFRVSDGAIVDASTRNLAAGGNIIIDTNIFEATNGGQIQTVSLGDGAAGTITVNAAERIRIEGQDPTFATRQVEFGIRRIGLVTVSDGSSGLFALSEGNGRAGDIVAAAPIIELDNFGKISAESASGDGGNISVISGDLLLLRRGSSISTSAGTAQAGGDGGNITINAANGFVIAVPQENSDVSANAFAGRGGQVNITTRGLFGLEFRSQQTPLSDITASSQFGIAGNAVINSPDTSFLQNGLTSLPENIVDTSQLVSGSCIARTEGRGSFVVTGRDGLPNRPEDAPISAYPTSAVRSGETAALVTPIWQAGDPVIEPEGVYRLANGRLVLSHECR